MRRRAVDHRLFPQAGTPSPAPVHRSRPAVRPPQECAMNHPTTRLLAAAAVAPLLLLGACGSEDPGAAPGADGDKVKIAAIFSGPTNDADYNALGLQALQAAEKGGAEISYTEK